MFALVRRLQELEYYAGDFELPKITDCEDPGECHNWSGKAYIDNFAKVSTNWDYMGGVGSDRIHFDSFADDSWNIASAPPVMPMASNSATW